MFSQASCVLLLRESSLHRSSSAVGERASRQHEILNFNSSSRTVLWQESSNAYEDGLQITITMRTDASLAGV